MAVRGGRSLCFLVAEVQEKLKGIGLDTRNIHFNVQPRENETRARLRLPRVLAVCVAAVLAVGMIAAKAVGHPGPDPAGRGSVTAANGLPTRDRGGIADLVAPDRTSSTTAPGITAAYGVSGLQSTLPAAKPSSRPGRPAAVHSLPTPAARSLPSVPALHTVEQADAVVLLSQPITPSGANKVEHLRGVAGLEEVDTGTVTLAGAPAVTFGVDPATFRDFTPAASASSDELWRYVAGGSLVSSYEMATDRKLKLGSELPIVGAAGGPAVRGWLGAFASIGLPGVDLLVSHTYSAALGLTPDAGLVVSAPTVTGTTLQKELQGTLRGATIELLRLEQFPDDLPGNLLSAQQRQAIITAALSKVGRPYVWGGAGPNVFDCSGLVQWSFRQAGILMPRTAAEQFLTGDHIPLADAQPGDLLYWTYDPNDPGFVDHTAIYLGNDLMVVAPHTGLDVEVAPVPTSDFAGAVEVVLDS